MAITGTQAMTYNTSGRRIGITRQQQYTDRRLNTLYIITDLARLSFVDNSGINWPDVPYTKDNGGSGFVNVFTDSSGSRHPTPGILSRTNTKWRILNGDTTLRYTGSSKVVQFYASAVVRPNATNYSINSANITNQGTGYTSAPTVTITGDGTGATAVAAIDIATGKVTDIIITNGGSGYTTATVSFSGGGGIDAAATAVLSAATVLTFSIYKNGSPIDSSTDGKVIADPNNTYTSNVGVSVVNLIDEGDEITLMVQNESNSALSYNFYNAILAVRPIEMVGK